MEQESLDAYNIQLEYMRNNLHLFSEEDIGVLNFTLQQQQPQQQQQRPSQAMDDTGSNMFQYEGEEGEEDDQAQDQEGVDEDEWSYERLLAIGQTLGGLTNNRSCP